MTLDKQSLSLEWWCTAVPLRSHSWDFNPGSPVYLDRHFYQLRHSTLRISTSKRSSAIFYFFYQKKKSRILLQKFGCCHHSSVGLNSTAHVVRRLTWQYEDHSDDVDVRVVATSTPLLLELNLIK